jgi:hypothetical protein
MIMGARLGLAARTLAVVAFCGLQAAPSSAQLLWDWGGGDAVDSSGREIVRFNPQYSKGQVIVSFGDRRLYFITQPGEAISYPIAVPREQSRWEGVLSVTQKRENPAWTPTPTMLAENPRLPRWVPGGHPMNPLGVRGLYLGASMYRIHGTDAPWTIGTAVSKGCIRFTTGMCSTCTRGRHRRQGDGPAYRTFATGNAVASRPRRSRRQGLVGARRQRHPLRTVHGEDDPPPAERPRVTKSKASPKAATPKDKSAAVGATPE